MAKRYVYKVLYGNKVIEKIDVVTNEEDAAMEAANDIALDRLNVVLEEVIEEE